MFDEKAFHAHFPIEISDEIKDYITNCAMDWSRYLFTHREGRKQWAFCTNCKKEHPSDGLKHGKMAECPHCRATATVKASGRGRSTLVDRAYMLWYEKSVLNPEILIARGIYAVRDYTKDYRKTETKLVTIALYLFEYGSGGRMLVRDGPSSKWWSPKNVRSEAIHSMNYVRSYFARHSIEAAVKGTPFQYCQWELYDHHDRVMVFDLAARYRCIEFLSKIGLGPIVVAKLTGQATYGAINWNGSTPEKVLRISKAEIKAMRNAKLSIGARTLRSYQVSRKDGSNLDWEGAQQLSFLLETPYKEDLQKLLVYAPVWQIKNYIIKQLRKDAKNYRSQRHYNSGQNVFTDYRDYLNECKELGMDLSQEHVLFPNNLHSAHQKTMRKVKIKADAALNAKIAARLKDLERYRFEHSGLILRPAASSIELFDEGKALNHCVGGYADRYAKGETDLFVIRRVEQPDQPFYTMEVRNGNVVQCRGQKNCVPTPEVKAFVEMFVSKKLLTKKRTRVGVAV
ncbi:PcfJ domain-containing protein [Paenibacillus ehimensis]|uniref:PcfJ domain-containing protein n=1 Tax=Paenibacillus ehimensis TaxID=79264 RepID=A0ABT8VHH4_9BACL|nr:PcfJ domain-containing protein [Paenibacillus ehimensis]MDO3680409.1 PcfJ domain-containing protein [Paenibacillus ehimensis]